MYICIVHKIPCIGTYIQYISPKFKQSSTEIHGLQICFSVSFFVTNMEAIVGFENVW